ncbi:BTAD domain-containing putative transcriptional regulator [Streptomyces sp. NPDC050549]|uniref:AfsR/SARP family transcriptional regulator n=1 Tax=Streptomyces sp. NPDC050549 TaxID=3155406 RepID=UPI00341CE344
MQEPVPRTPKQRHVPSESGLLRFSVLGPVRAWRGDEPLSTGSAKQRVLLVSLLLREGETATAHELIEALWGEDPPSTALAMVGSYVSALRRALGPGVLLSEPGGYAIRGLTEGALDLTMAQNLAAEAQRAKGSRDLERARALLNRALSLWDGEEPLAGVPGPYAEAQRARLGEWRLQLIETRLDLDLEQGCHAEAMAELATLAAAHPLRERLCELLMLALYRSGRQAEALAVYADTKQMLWEELRVGPRGSLSDLQQRILRADPILAEPLPPPAPEPAAVQVRPAQLPATVADFTGRVAFVSELSEVLASAEGRVMAVSALAGIGGVGKTTLAVHVAYQARSAFPDGQLYVDLQGAGSRAAEPETVLGAFLRALGTPDSAIPDSLEERAALYRSMLDGRRMLVLLDNAKDVAQVRPLLPGTEGCAALVTARVRMVDLGAHLVDLDVMSPEEALQLFTKIVGAERVTAERESALDVVAACGFLPLAIRIAASRLAALRTWTVSELAAELADERRRLDELQAGDLAVKATFELGYGQLEPAQARAFRLLSLADGPDISLAAAAAVLNLETEETEDLLESLVDTSLLKSAAPGRYRFHDLVRLYARARAERDEQPPREREAAMSRLLDFYLATVAGVYPIERPGDRFVDHLERTCHPGLTFPDRHAARDWLSTEAISLLACVRQSARPGTLRRAVDLLWAAVDLAESGVDSKEYEAVAVLLRNVAEEAGDTRSEARARVGRAFVRHVSGNSFDVAAQEADRAAALAAAADDPLTTCWSSNINGAVAMYRNRYDDAEAHFTRAIESFRALEDRLGEASALCNLSRIHLATGRTRNAVTLARQSTEIYDSMGNSMRGADARYVLGLALTRSGDLDSATIRLLEALEVFRESRQRLWEGMALFRLAEVDIAGQHYAQAAANAEAALTVLHGIGGEWRHATVLTVLGRALTGVGQTDRARVCQQEALRIFEEVGSPEAAELRVTIQSRVGA